MSLDRRSRIHSGSKAVDHVVDLRSRRKLAPVPAPLDAPRGTRLARTGPIGRTTPEQRARCAEQVCVVCGRHFGLCETAHAVPRGHVKMSEDAANDPRACVPLCPGPDGCHRAVDEGRIELLPHLEPAWRDTQEWAAGAVGIASAYRSLTGGDR